LDAEFDHTHQHLDRSRTNWVYQQAVEVSGQIFSDQTGRFPVTSSKGNQYIMVKDYQKTISQYTQTG
jgi:hypothetical protein